MTKTKASIAAQNLTPLKTRQKSHSNLTIIESPELERPRKDSSFEELMGEFKLTIHTRYSSKTTRIVYDATNDRWIYACNFEEKIDRTLMEISRGKKASYLVFSLEDRHPEYTETDPDGRDWYEASATYGTPHHYGANLRIAPRLRDIVKTINGHPATGMPSNAFERTFEVNQ